MNVKYFSKIMRGTSFKRLSMVIEEAHEKTGKNRVGIFFDIISCFFKYGAGYMDYKIFEFYNMNASERSTYMTRVKNKKFIEMENDPEYTYLFEKKNIFDEKFKDFIHRDFIDLEKSSKEEVKEFVKNKKEVVAKPATGECGHGIEIIKIKDFKNFDKFYDYIKQEDKNFGVLEEKIIQHPKLSELYPDSVNCFRMVTLVHEGVPHVLYAVLKTGNNGNFVDNLESGGYACHFDLENARICGPAHTSDQQLCEVHPVTNVKFEGFEVPFVKEAMELTKKAALVVPEVKYVGWDVCIMKDGPAIIEGNVYAAYDFPQLPDRSQHKEGLLKKLEDIGIKL